MSYRFVNPIASYSDLLGPIPEDCVEETSELDFIHAFFADAAKLEEGFPKLMKALKPTGMLWVSWPKKASKMPSDLDENIVREIGLAAGLVDVKVIAVDENWSGLKFVYRLRDR